MPSSPLTATSSPLSEPPDESENKDANKSARPRRSGRMGSTDQVASEFMWACITRAIVTKSLLAKKPVSLSQPVVPPPVFYDKRENMKGTSEVSEGLH